MDISIPNSQKKITQAFKNMNAIALLRQLSPSIAFCQIEFIRFCNTRAFYHFQLNSKVIQGCLKNKKRLFCVPKNLCVLTLSNYYFGLNETLSNDR